MCPYCARGPTGFGCRLWSNETHVTRAADTSSALTEPTFSGHRPAAAGDLSVETHGIAPIAEDQRYGTPARLFTVWFAPQVNMTGVFTGTLAIVLGLGFWLGLLAMVIGTVLGSLVVAYLSTWGPRTGTGAAAQLTDGVRRRRRCARRPAVAVLDRLGRARRAVRRGSAAVLLGIPFWVAVLIVLGVQGAVGFFGYELDPPVAGGVDRGAVRDVRGVRGETRWRA